MNEQQKLCDRIVNIMTIIGDSNTDNKKDIFYKVFFNNSIALNGDNTINTKKACINFLLNSPKSFKMFVNPDYISNLDDKQIKSLIFHMILHIIYKHFDVRKKDKKIWNIATDLFVNNILEKENFKIINNSLLPSKLGFPTNYEKAEQYYKYLKQINYKTNCELVDDHLCFGKTEENNNYKKIIDYDNIKYNIDEIVKKHYKTTKEVYGVESPEYIKNIVYNLLKQPSVDWKKILQKQIQISIKNGHRKSYMRSSRRYNVKPFIFKGNITERIAKICLVIDTSRSIKKENFDIFWSEIYEIYKQYPIELRVIEWNHDKPNKDILFVKNDRLYKKYKIDFNYGNSDFIKFFEYFEKNKCVQINKTKSYKYLLNNNIDLLIYFTDGRNTYFPKKQIFSTYKVLWAIADNVECNIPFGIKIKLN